VSASLDHLVGTGEQSWRQLEAKRPSRLEIDDELVFGRRLHRQIGRLFALEDTIHVAGRTSIRSARRQSGLEGGPRQQMETRDLVRDRVAAARFLLYRLLGASFVVLGDTKQPTKTFNQRVRLERLV
jgi:hypothetical protein